MTLDPFTADTLRSMVRYITDDGRIARYLGIEPKFVRAARRRLPTGPSAQPAERPRAERKPPRIWSPADIADILKRHPVEGTGVLAREYGVSPDSLRNVLARYRGKEIIVPRQAEKYRAWTMAEIHQVLEMSKRQTRHEIAAHFGVSPGAIRELRRRNRPKIS
jgi:lambda repressor-like predicted transcriptional regulator